MKQQSIKVNWIFNVANKLIGALSPLIVTPYVSRIFGAEGIGINSYTTANVTYFTLFCMLGIAGYGQREMAICRDNKEKVSKLFAELFIVHMITSIVVLGGYLLLIIYSTQYRLYYIVNLFAIFSAVFNFNWFFEAFERFKKLSIRNIIIQLITLVLTFILIREKDDLPIYIAINGLSTLVANFIMFISIKNDVEFVRMQNLNWKRHFKEVWVYFVPTIAASVYSILDRSVINWITKSDEENGYYEQAWKILAAANMAVQSLATVTAPRMSNLFSEGKFDELRLRLNKSLHIMIFMAIPIMFGMASVTPVLIPVFLGQDFGASIPILYIFVPLVIIQGFSVYLDGLYIVPSGQRGKSAIIVCIGAAINFVLNIVMTYYWKAFGAAIATLITEASVTIMMMFVARKWFDINKTTKEIIKYSIPGVVMFIFVRMIANNFRCDIVSLVIQSFIGGIIYIGILLIFRDEIIQSMLKKIKNLRSK